MIDKHRGTAAKARRTLATAGAAALFALSVGGCGGDSLEQQENGGGSDDGSGGSKGELVVGSAGFTESTVLARLYSQLLADAGFQTSVKTLNNRELYEPALEKGDIHVVPEYAATLAEFLNAKTNGPDAEPVASNDVDETVAALKKLAEPRGLTVLPAGKAVDQNAFAVTEEFAARHDLQTLSDLGESGQEIRLAAGDECGQRPYCRPGLEETYAIRISGVDPKGVGTVQAKQSVKDGTNQLVLTTTTDATLDDFGLTLLEDDKGLQNADNVLPVLNAQKASGEAGEDIAAALNKLTRVLTTEDLVELNRRVDSAREKPADVAAEYLEGKDLLSS